jgi:hypothetical protein
VPHLALSKGVKYLFDEFEPYYGFYFWLCKHGFEILYLDAEQWKHEKEGISTVLKDHTRTPFVVHTWYAREYSPPRMRFRRLVKDFLRGVYRLCRQPKHGPHYERIQRAVDAVRQMREQRSG